MAYKAVMQTVRSHRDLILALGGPTKLARKLGLKNPSNTTVHWSARGIPSRYWHRVCELAASQIQITAHDLERLPPRRSEAPRRAAA